ncbi:MAG: MCE family protein [Bacteroidetes bacterium]|nr:MCE family protein [Bacteroidota bacterium]
MTLSKEVKTGIVVVVGLSLFIYGFNFLKGSNLFKNQKTIYAVYTNVDGLLESNNVQLSGLKVGLVKSIKLMPNDRQGRILVTMSVEDNVNIPSDSRARIVSSDLLGTKSIRFELGTSSSLVKSGDTLVSEREDDLRAAVDKRIAPLQKKAEGLIASIDSVMIVVQEVLNKDARHNLTKSFESIKRAIATFEKTALRLDTLVYSQQHKLSVIFSKMESITSNLANNNDKITKVLANFESISDSLAKSKIKTTINNANEALSDVSKILAKINRGEGSMGLLVNNDSLYKKLDKSANELDLLMLDLRTNPKRYVHFSVFGRKDKSKKKQPVTP